MRQAKLAVEFYAVHPPRPARVCVLIQGSIIGYVTLKEFDRTAAKLAELRAARAEHEGAQHDGEAGA